ncbi:MAG: DNA polymerase III subunit alpha [Anaerolineales bacterium]|nr:DNA polymerase III subunit alpha [Anaerolineales bacterium]
MYIHLTAHSAYSLQEGLATPEELVQAAKSHGLSALGLTEHNLLTGAIEFVAACKHAGIQPILGLEVDLQQGPLHLLAASLTGWSNLCKISSAIALQNSSNTTLSLETLKTFSKDLLALSDHSLEDLQAIFPNNLYVSLNDPAKALELSKRARQLGLPTVVTHPIYYLTPDQASLQHTLSAIRLNRSIHELPISDAAPAGSHFTNPQEMETRFQDFPDALKATVEIAERCRFDLPLGLPNMPKVPLPEGVSSSELLRQKAFAGAQILYGEITPEIQTRLDHELNVIAQMGFEPIFLIVEEVLNYARKTGVPFSSRGSAASSLVAHCLGITSPDPLRLNLYFERFLNPARLTPPDIDTDLCSRRRDSIIQHVFDVYGADHVAMVGTINRFRPRSAFSDAAKAHGIAPAKVREMANQLPHSFWAKFEDGKESASPFADLHVTYPQYRHVFDDAEAILKLPRHLSVHPGGVIVSPGPLTDLVPVMRSGSKGIIITQLDLDSVEALGLVKIDLLGIRGLTVLGDVAEFIQEGQPNTFSNAVDVLESTPAEDKATSNRIEYGETIGCFQIESPGMRSTLREIHARTEDDIMAALALYRPGPLSGGLKDAFVRRFKGEEKVHHIHSALAPLLDDTFGVILYQEQVLRIAHELAGFSLAEADLLRRAMSHFDPGKKMQELQRKFVDQSQQKSGVPLETGERIWEMMAAFAGYGFPKAHAASYAQVAWRSAWCKSYFPAEFMAAVLANWGGYYSQRVYLSEARRMGLAVRPPHVNYPSHNFSVKKLIDSNERALFMGLGQVKELTQRTIERILRYAPFTSLDDFLSRVDPRAQEAESLARIGALEGMGKIPAILNRLESGSWQKNQMSLFEWTDSNEEDWSVEQKVNAQQEILGVSLEAHPLELVADKVNASGAISTIEAAGRIGRRVTIAGVRQTSHRSRTAKGDSMLFLTVEDLMGTLDAIAFPDVYRVAKEALSSTFPMLLTGVMEMDTSRGEPYMKIERVVVISSGEK